jgi:hypothetical protein
MRKWITLLLALALVLAALPINPTHAQSGDDEDDPLLTELLAVEGVELVEFYRVFPDRSGAGSHAVLRAVVGEGANTADTALALYVPLFRYAQENFPDFLPFQFYALLAGPENTLEWVWLDESESWATDTLTPLVVPDINTLLDDFTLDNTRQTDRGREYALQNEAFFFNVLQTDTYDPHDFAEGVFQEDTATIRSGVMAVDIGYSALGPENTVAFDLYDPYHDTFWSGEITTDPPSREALLATLDQFTAALEASYEEALASGNAIPREKRVLPDEQTKRDELLALIGETAANNALPLQSIGQENDRLLVTAPHQNAHYEDFVEYQIDLVLTVAGLAGNLYEAEAEVAAPEQIAFEFYDGATLTRRVSLAYAAARAYASGETSEEDFLASWEIEVIE